MTEGGTSGVFATGPHDTNDYGVFVIDENDYEYYWNGSQQTGYGNTGDGKTKVQAVAASLKTYFDAKLDAGYSKPIFIASHLPLHYSSRTQAHGDNKFGKYLFDEINAAAEAGLNIIYICGHNHSQGYDDYLGGAAYYFEPGEKIFIAVPPTNSTSRPTTYTTETLAFTYMNAGYVGYYDDKNSASDNDTTLTMTAFTITDTDVTISRYDANGEHNLKSKGYDTAYNSYDMDGFAFDGSTDAKKPGVVSSPRTLELKGAEPTPTFEYTDNGVTVSGTGLCSGITATLKSSGDSYNDKIAKYALYSFTATGFEDYVDTATVYLPIPDGFTKPTVYYVNGTSLEKISTAVSDGYAAFTTNHFSDYLLGDPVPAAIEWTDPIYVSGESSYIYTLDTDGEINQDKPYLIVAPNSGYALIVNGSSLERAEVTVSDDTITLDTDTYDWMIDDKTTTTDYSYTKVNNNPNRSALANQNYSSWHLTSYYYKVGDNYYPVYVKRSTNSSASNRYDYTYGYSTTSSESNVTQIGKTETKVKSSDRVPDTIVLYTRSSTTKTTYRIGSNGMYLSGSATNPSLGTASRWLVDSYSTSNGQFEIHNTFDGSTRYLRYYDNAFSFYNDSSSYRGTNLRLFYLSDEIHTDPETYYLGLSAEDFLFAADRFETEAAADAYIRSQIAVYRADDLNGEPDEANKQTITSYTFVKSPSSVNVRTDGEYTYTVMVDGKPAGSFTVEFKTRAITNVTMKDGAEGTVYRASNSTADTGATLTVTYDDNTSEEIPITLGMVTNGVTNAKNVGDYNTTVKYGGHTLDFKLNVINNPAENDYPRLPEPGRSSRLEER